MVRVAEKNPKKPDRHKVKALQLRLHPLLRKQLKELAKRNLTTLTTEAVAAIRKHLSENDLWPPPPE